MSDHHNPLASDPKFTIGFTHCGVSLTLSATVVAKDYVTIVPPDRESNEHLCDICSAAIVQTVLEIVPAITKLHESFSQALDRADLLDHRAYSQPLTGGLTSKTKDSS